MRNKTLLFFVFTGDATVFSSSFRDVTINPLHVQLPLVLGNINRNQSPSPVFVPQNEWVTICVDVSKLVSQVFPGNCFRSLDFISIAGSLKLRQIFTLRDSPAAGNYCSFKGKRPQTQNSRHQFFLFYRCFRERSFCQYTPSTSISNGSENGYPHGDVDSGKYRLHFRRAGKGLCYRKKESHKETGKEQYSSCFWLEGPFFQLKGSSHVLLVVFDLQYSYCRTICLYM